MFANKKGVPVSTPFSPLFTSFTSTVHIALSHWLKRRCVSKHEQFLVTAPTGVTTAATGVSTTTTGVTAATTGATAA
jgi:hypothetical protein